MTERVYILLPVHNRLGITRKFVDCLKIQTYRNFYLVLIDDGSTDGTDNMAQTSLDPEQHTVIKGRGNWWWAGSLQQGINWLKRHPPEPSDIVLIINDDVTFNKNFIENGVNELRRTTKTLLLAREWDEASGKTVETGVHADFQYLTFVVADSSEDINCLSTRGLFVRWDVLKQLGGVYPRLLPHYGSDYEFTMRAMRKGFSLCTNANVYLVSDSTATGFQKIAEGTNFKDVIKILFTKKSALNPVYWTSFILLASPMKWIPINILKVWRRAGLAILKSISS